MSLCYDWQGRQLNIQAYDIDNNAENAPWQNLDLVDAFSINIEQIQIGVEAEPQTFNGTFGFGWIELSYRVNCTGSFYFPNCDSSCALIGNCTCLPGFTGRYCEVYSTPPTGAVVNSTRSNSSPGAASVKVTTIIIAVVLILLTVALLWILVAITVYRRSEWVYLFLNRMI